MLIIPTLLLSVSFLTQVAVLAAPIPPNGVSIDTRAPYDDALFSRTGTDGSNAPPNKTPPGLGSGTFASTW